MSAVTEPGLAAFRKMFTVEVLERLRQRLEDPLDPQQSGARAIKWALARVFAWMEGPPPAQEAAFREIERLADVIDDWDAAVQLLPELASEMRERLLRDDRLAGYMGVRSELSFAGYLARHSEGLTLRRGQDGTEPDFLIVSNVGTAGFECTSAHLTAPAQTHFHKISRAIRRKSQKEYCNRESALYVENTALMRHAGDSIEPSFPDRVRRVLSETNWGAVLISSVFVQGRFGLLTRGFLRFDAHTQGAALSAALDRILPQGEVHVGRVWFPEHP